MYFYRPDSISHRPNHLYMKTLYLVRHAKSSWAEPDLTDMERPLNKRGNRDAPFMAKLLKARGAVPDAFVSSPANRAMTTARFFSNEFGVSPKGIVQKPEIYEATAGMIIDMVGQFSDHWKTVVLFGHNPTFTTLANLFSDRFIPNVPTCGIIHIESDIKNWATFEAGKGKVIDFHFPKQYFPKKDS
jgi:phosphohistidine phosphatase